MARPSTSVPTSPATAHCWRSCASGCDRVRNRPTSGRGGRWLERTPPRRPALHADDYRLGSGRRCDRCQLPGRRQAFSSRSSRRTAAVADPGCRDVDVCAHVASPGWPPAPVPRHRCDGTPGIVPGRPDGSDLTQIPLDPGGAGGHRSYQFLRSVASSPDGTHSPSTRRRRIRRIPEGSGLQVHVVEIEVLGEVLVDHEDPDRLGDCGLRPDVPPGRRTARVLAESAPGGSPSF